MSKKIFCILIVACILMTSLFSGCGKTQAEKDTISSTELVTEKTGETTTETVIESTTTVTDNTTIENTTETTTKNETTTSSSETTTDKEDEPTTSRPTVDPPVINPGSQDAVDAYFNDVAFIGDSIGVGLSNRAKKTNKLTGATFLVRGSYGSGNAVNNILYLTYQGKQMTPQDAVAACGAKKVFIMLGMNDLNVYGLQGSVDNMATLINRILAKSPDVQIFIQSMTPIVIGSEAGKLNNTSIDEYNSLLKEFAINNGYTYIDISSYLKDDSNGLKKSYSSDNYVHLSNTGNDVYIAALESFAQSQIPPEENPIEGGTEDEPTMITETTTEYVETQQLENSKRRNVAMTKKIVAASVILALVFSFCSCTAQKQDGNDNTVKQIADLRTLYETCVEKMPPMLLLDGEMMLDMSGVNPDNCEEYYVAICEDSLRADEIWLIKATDESKVQEIIDFANARIQARAEESKTYSPEQYAVVQKARVISQGEYVALIISPDVDEIAEIVMNAF